MNRNRSFIANSSSSVIVAKMPEVRDTHTEERRNKPRPWRPWRPPRRQTRRWVLWTVGMVIALGALGLLVAKRYPSIWEALSTERVATLIGIGLALTVIIVLLAIGGASVGWTGFGEKKLWDWLQLLSALAIPIVLAAAGFWFTAQQDARQQRIEDQRARQAQEIENQRVEAERELAQQRAQDEALQAYLDQMSQLVLQGDLRSSKEGSAVRRSLAQARTQTILTRLDGRRKGSVVQFLYEASLIDKEHPVVSLSAVGLPDDADLPNLNVGLRDADLRGLKLEGVDLSEANLREANLRSAHLDSADLSAADLREADLSWAILSGAEVSDADLRKAYLRYANLNGADLGGVDLRGAHMNGAYVNSADLIEADLIKADLREANLSFAKLRGARLNGVDLIDADLIEADLSDADLSDADLREANLSGAKGVTEERLEEQAKFLEGATMPNGSIHD